MSTTEDRGGGKMSYDDVRDMMREADAPVITTTELAHEFDISQQSAYYRLDRMHKNGEVDRMDVGANGVVWWLDSELKSRS